MTRRSCAIYAVGTVCATLLVLGIGLYAAQVFRTLMNNRLKKEIVLVEGSRVFESWKKPPPPVFMEFFFFNITNVAQVVAGEKPQVEQIGPYTYREYRYKDNVSMVENGQKVSAYTMKSFVFLPEKSVGDPFVDTIVTVDIPAWAVMSKVKNSFFRASGLSFVMAGVGTQPFTTLTVHDLLWGYEDKLLSKVALTTPEVDPVFGLMHKKNGSHSGEFVYHTGMQNYMDYGRVATWKGDSRVSFWTSNQSNAINGSDGSAFHPLIEKNERLYIFTPDLCRSIYMEFEKEVEVRGVPAYRFTPPRSVLASKEENPANAGFCITPQECLGTGLLNVSPCRKGAPVVASFPHFYLADNAYVDAIGGMAPQREHHQTFIDLNPTTGVIVRANKRAQVNVLIERISGIPSTRNLKPTILPVMFINESVVIDEASAARVQKLLKIADIVPNLPLILVGLGGIMLAVLIVLLIRARKQKSEAKRVVFTKPIYSTKTEDNTSYSPVTDKEKDDGQNGTYIGLAEKSDEQT